MLICHWCGDDERGRPGQIFRMCDLKSRNTSARTSEHECTVRDCSEEVDEERGEHPKLDGKIAEVSWQARAATNPRCLDVYWKCDVPPCCNRRFLWINTHIRSSPFEPDLRYIMWFVCLDTGISRAINCFLLVTTWWSTVQVFPSAGLHAF